MLRGAGVAKLADLRAGRHSRGASLDSDNLEEARIIMFDRRSRRARVWLVAVLCGAATIASGRVAAQSVVTDREQIRVWMYWPATRLRGLRDVSLTLQR
jgi:hypothetical protein